MFDIGFWELTVLGVIALIVLGPERLPVVARTLGQWVGRAKGYMREVTSELEREVRVDEIRDEVKRAREQIESETRDSVEPVMKPLDPNEAPDGGDTVTGSRVAESSESREPTNGTVPASASSSTSADSAAAAAKNGAGARRAASATTTTPPPSNQENTRE